MSLQTVKEKLEAIPGLSVSEKGTGNLKFLYVQSTLKLDRFSMLRLISRWTLFSLPAQRAGVTVE
jgi:hypothetical protein